TVPFTPWMVTVAGFWLTAVIVPSILAGFGLGLASAVETTNSMRLANNANRFALCITDTP
ncbi:MAG TPA: hypothetical protein VK689_18975, partial [Armatimonadota bacterium]|nr:hypothetical protein [Armatimonadota bacterium]